MTTFRSTSVLGIVLLGVACGDAIGPITRLPRDLTVAERALIEADRRFAFDLLREVVARDTAQGNVFISPLSVSMALGMAYNGAAGVTREGMAAGLGFGDLTVDDVNAGYRGLLDLFTGLDPRVELSVANSMWFREGYPPLPSFIETGRQVFDAEVATLDFASPEAVETINEWVNDRTRGRIPEILDGIPRNVIAYLINAVYFLGDWTYRFDPERTAPDRFLTERGASIMVPMMRTDAEVPLLTARLDGASLLDLSYGGGAYRMTILMPDDPGALTAVLASLSPSSWLASLERLDSTSAFVHLPKFSFEFGQELSGALAALGMDRTFCGQGPPWDFSNMYGSGADICVTAVNHKTFVEVDEQGTEAAAVTSIEFGIVSAPPAVRIDRPFIFVIREALSETILFAGIVRDPR